MGCFPCIVHICPLETEWKSLITPKLALDLHWLHPQPHPSISLKHKEARKTCKDFHLISFTHSKKKVALITFSFPTEPSKLNKTKVSHGAKSSYFYLGEKCLRDKVAKNPKQQIHNSSRYTKIPSYIDGFDFNGTEFREPCIFKELVRLIGLSRAIVFKCGIF